MGIGNLLLDGALAVVALWLIAELLLQNRAPLVWRAVALGGFLLVVAGMQLSSVLVIGAGAAGFAVGQTFVTLSVKRGRVVGWSLRRADGALPGPLAKVPLLAAATGGAVAAADEVEDVPVVGEVGPIEDEPVAVEPVAYEQYQELADDGVYAAEPTAVGYYPDQQQAYYPQTGYDQQQWGYYQQGYQQQQAYAFPQQQYQDPYAQQQQQQEQQQYQDPYGGQPQGWDQQQAYPGIPQQPGYGYQTQPQPQAQPQQQNWDYQQQV
ncbi:hypothetical protein ACGFX4_16570 [Kitasatospora sp. NPDC048365]|uniref:hypothetical protein n=1 Tax=Kitasatospora sp. NPDC048365 TaxID=3364050 RepID=UPI00371D62B5